MDIPAVGRVFRFYDAGSQYHHSECLRLHYGGKPPPRPPPRSYSRLFVPPSDCACRRARLTVSTLRHTEVSRRGVPPRSAERTAKPIAESCDICAIVTIFSL